VREKVFLQKEKMKPYITSNGWKVKVKIEQSKTKGIRNE